MNRKFNESIQPGSPLISIIVAVFNGGATLQKCLDSIAMQTYPNKELIVIDGGSSDETVNILKTNSKTMAYWASEPDNGIAHAWNKGLRKSRGEWILFIGADDRLQDDRALSDIADVLRNNRVDDVVYGQIIFEGGPVHGQVVGSGGGLRAIRRRMVIPHTGAFHRRCFFDEVGKFDESFKMAMDYELLLRKKALSASFVDRRITVMGGEGVSSRLVKKSLLEGRAAQIKNKADWRFKIEAWHAFYQLRNLVNLWRT